MYADTQAERRALEDDSGAELATSHPSPDLLHLALNPFQLLNKSITGLKTLFEGSCSAGEGNRSERSEIVYECWCEIGRI